MTRKEAIKHIENIMPYVGRNIKDALDMAIEALGQKLCDDVSDTNVGDIISRQAAIDALSYMCSEDENGITVSRANVNSMLRVLPPVTPQEPKTGHWISLYTGKPSRIKDGISTESVRCSECDEWLTASDEYACKGNYCPNCGAKMVEPQERSE